MCYQSGLLPHDTARGLQYQLFGLIYHQKPLINLGMQGIYDDAVNEVHRSNMAKLVDGKVLRREDGKVLKPEGWQPPQLAQFIPDDA